MGHSKITKYQSGNILLQEGEHNDMLFKLLSGKVALYLNYGKTNEYLIETLTAPQYFGEVSVLMSYPSYCTVIALEDTAVLHLPATDFEEFIKNNPQNALLIMNAMATSLHSLNMLLHKIENNDYTVDPLPLSTTTIQNNPVSEPFPAFVQPEETEVPEVSEVQEISEVQESPPTEMLSDELQLRVQQTLANNLFTQQNEEQRIQSILQTITQEPAIPEATASPCPSFYLPEHKSYPNITHPEYKPFLFAKEYTCPHCKRTFPSTQIAYTRLSVDPMKSKEIRYDFHPYYVNFEAEWYEVITCPHCYFSSLIDVFLQTGRSIRTDLFEDALLQIRSEILLDFSAEKTLDFVFAQYYIALACAHAFSNYRQVNACLWMNLYWLYRSVSDKECMRLTQEKALAAYIDMYQECPLEPEVMQRTALTIAGIYFELEDYESARRWAFAVRSNWAAKPIYRSLAETLIDDARRLSEMQAASEQSTEPEPIKKRAFPSWKRS